MKIFTCALCLLSVWVFSQAQPPNPGAPTLQRPDGKKADTSKPVQVFICLGQSNMLGFGRIAGDGEGALEFACKTKGLYPHLIDDDGFWTVRKDVRNVFVMSSGLGDAKTLRNDWLTMSGDKFGPEIGIGHHLGEALEAPVLILKSCIGNRSLGWDLLPPGSKQYEYKGKIQAGYGEADGGIPKEDAPGAWYAGLQYDGDIRNAKTVLASLGKHYPGATDYEVAGFFWWQGDKDSRNEAHAEKYEENLLALIAALRKDFNAPRAKFVCATLGQTPKDAEGNQGKILQAKMNVDGRSGKYPEHSGMVATVYTHPLSKGGSSGGHYRGHAETYMNVGEAMGREMVRLLKERPQDGADVVLDQIRSAWHVGDAYEVSQLLHQHNAGLLSNPESRALIQEIESSLATQRMQQEIAFGKTFHNMLNIYSKSEARGGGKRTDERAQKYHDAFKKLASRFGDSPYAGAARQASEELKDPSKPFQPAAYYLKSGN